MKRDLRLLRDLYAGLRSHFGYHPKWWPGDSMEIALTTILVQQCDWSAAWKAIERLRASGLLSLSDLAHAGRADVLQCIRGVAFAPTKAGRLIEFAKTLRGWGFGDIETVLRSGQTGELRPRLLTLNGVGEETADCILLFAGAHASFVVDAYTRRAFSRLKLFPRVSNSFWTSPYHALKAFFEARILDGLELYSEFGLDPFVPREVALFRDFHAQIVELGKHHCLKRGPLCNAMGKQGWRDYEVCTTHCGNAGDCTVCPLSDECRTGRKLRGVPASKVRSLPSAPC